VSVRSRKTARCCRIGWHAAGPASQKPTQPIHKAGSRGSVKLASGKVRRILSNDTEASAQHIADLYKRSWAIELFFRWVKQTLKIRHFLGTGENAIRIRIAVVLIAFLLLCLA
jgi:IS4 transposase